MSDLIQLFKNYKNNTIALYGLSTETEKALISLDSVFHIVGLLDGFRTEGKLYGKSIISLEEAVQNDVSLIIVVARPGSCRAIAKRIGCFCKEHKIALLDIRGKDLLEFNKIVYDFKYLEGITRRQLETKIKSAEVVSFDLFDTLVIRQVLDATDVIELVNCRLQEQGIFIQDFCKKRLGSEKELSQHDAPTLIDIYVDVLRKCDISEFTAAQLAELEWKIDYDLLVPRKEVCELFREVNKEQKSLYVVSDSYYKKSQLMEILKKCDIVEYTDVISSCEYGTSKKQKLFGVLLEKEHKKKCVHIGDDLISDIESASRYGIDSCQIFSGLDLLENVGYLGLSEYMVRISDRIKVGMFISNVFNSPFQLEATERKITVAETYNIGYFFFAPMIADFVMWFYRKVQQLEIPNVWFCARDGYLIQKMYGELDKENNSIYFLTSRMAAVRAGMECESDIAYVDEMKFGGTLEENLNQRFGINSKNLGREEVSEEECGLLKYKKPILKKAKKEYKHYKEYINKLSIKEGDIAYFDFVAKGTCQMYIQRLVHNSLKGLYFLQLEEENMKDKGLDIQSFYTMDDMENSVLFENYYILETILTAPHPSVYRFEQQGEPVYMEETRTEKDILCFGRVQEGILDYFKTYLRLCPMQEIVENKKLDEVFLALIQKIEIKDDDFGCLMVEDPFFNRMTSIIDLL